MTRSIYSLSLLSLLFSSATEFSLASQTPIVLPQATQSPPRSRIAVIGAGAGGTSAAFWTAKAKARHGLDIEVDVFDKNDYVGGRSTVVWPYDEHTFEPVELGGSIFVKANKNLWRAVDEFNLQHLNFENADAVMGIWDGQQFRLTLGGGGFYNDWLDKFKVIWRYGFRSPQKTLKIVNGMIEDISTLYKPAPPVFDSISSLSAQVGWDSIASQHTLQYLRANGVGDLFTTEFVDSFTRVNYGQDVERIHAIEGFVSVATSGASSVKGGNFQIYEGFLKKSNATVFLNTTIESISRESPTGPWEVRVGGTNETQLYDFVIVAAPIHQTGIKFRSEPSLATVPPQPYVHLHVTLLTTTSLSVNSSYFNLPQGAANVPSIVLTTYDGARHGGPEPEFNSLSYLHPVRKSDSNGSWTNAQGEPEWVVKIFSKEQISDAWLDSMFYGQVGWVHRKEWDAYPVLPPTTEFPPVKLAEGLYYVNAFEPLISTMETETVAARNAVELLLRDHFDVGLCKPRLSEDGAVHVAADDFVYGWDC